MHKRKTYCCQCCGKPIRDGQNVVGVIIGKFDRGFMEAGANFDSVDFFHEKCDVAIRKKR